MKDLIVKAARETAKIVRYELPVRWKNRRVDKERLERAAKKQREHFGKTDLETVKTLVEYGKEGFLGLNSEVEFYSQLQFIIAMLAIKNLNEKESKTQGETSNVLTFEQGLKAG